ncbi:hypothetical protein DPM19_18130 [Actinomadura craniellae]|uniref:HTH cro/C1-type domain-containing protein n=1 Tax=Actinomadura craniellae TaxID=2231787 RepID=A0A365H3B8_9ACTN|nr:helix-turn-helix transcriptional regulator [Actinomadura craniellae]RAY13597.1 hypothetical protein DPM19_18130 [Actinomadura craniellae]
MTERSRPAWAARLQTEREDRRWSKAELGRRLRAETGSHRALESLTSQIRAWERGDHFPRDYVDTLAAVFGLDPDDLFPPSERPLWGPAGAADAGITPDDEERLVMAARHPARLDTAVVEGLSATLANQRRIEDMIGSGAVIGPATAHMRLTLRLLKEARGPVADRLTATASEASQFAGWLHTAIGAHDAASPLYDQALRLGMQAGDPDLTATALSMHGHLAWVTGDIASMATLSRAAAEQATATGTRTVAIQQGGRALAILGDRQGALRAIGHAEEALSSAGGGDPDSLYFYGPAMLTMQRGLILAYLADTPAEHTAAADVITAGIEALPPTVRDSEWVAWYRVQAAIERAAGGQVEQSVSALRVALGIVSATGGGKTRATIAQTYRSMAARWPDHSAVVELGEALR